MHTVILTVKDDELLASNQNVRKSDTMVILTQTSVSMRLRFISWKLWGSYFIPALRLLRDGIFRLWSKAPPTASSLRIRRQWLQSILQQKIASIDILPLDENRGFVGSMRRVRITLQDSIVGTASGDSSDTRTLSLILKTSLVSSSSGLSLGPMREARFYQTNDHDPALPKVYYASTNPCLREAVLLMQDLQNDDYVNVNLILGNQIWGTPCQTRDSQKLEMIQIMYRAAAELHAKHWNDETLLENRWMRNTNWWFGMDRHYWELSMKASYDGWRSLRTNPNLIFPPGFVEMINLSYDQSSFEHVREFVKESPFTLTHGDYHAANMMVKDKSLKILDWSEVGPWEPTTDLAQTIISDVPTKLFPHVEGILRRDYYDCLIDHNISYAWEDCRRRFGQSGMERWIWVLGVMEMFPCPDNLYQYFIDQMEAFRQAFCPEQDSFLLTTCGYVLPQSL